MKRGAGYTFIELIVVLGVIAVLATFSITLIPSAIKPRSLVLEADSLAAELFMMPSNARATRKTIKLLCDQRSINAMVYEGVRSNTLAPEGVPVVGLDARVQTQSKPSSLRPVLSEKSRFTVQCPTACGDLFVTSDGYLLSSNRCSSIDFILTKSALLGPSVKLTLSNLGYPRVFTRQSLAEASWSEVLR
jgi:hypothetical protein